MYTGHGRRLGRQEAPQGPDHGGLPWAPPSQCKKPDLAASLLLRNCPNKPRGVGTRGAQALWGRASGLLLGPAWAAPALLSGVCSSDLDDRPLSLLWASLRAGDRAMVGVASTQVLAAAILAPLPGLQPSLTPPPGEQLLHKCHVDRQQPPAGWGHHTLLLVGSPPEATGRVGQPQPTAMPATCWTGLQGAEWPAGCQFWENYLTFGGLSFLFFF